MPQLSGTFDTYEAVGNREDLSDQIYNIDPKETPFGGLIGSQKVKAVRHDWQIDNRRAPAANAMVEGDEYTYTEKNPTKRVANFTQISQENVRVTKTQDAVDKAGRESELNYQLSKATVELRRDIEFTMLSNVGSAAGDSATPRLSGGFPAWLTTNASRGAGGADGGFDPGTGLVAAAQNGSERTFSKVLLDDSMQSCWENGGRPTIVMVSPGNKRQFSSFMSDANVASFRMAADKTRQGVIMAAADSYVGDFGVVSVVPNEVMVNPALGRNVFLITPDMVARGVLRPFKQETPAKTGDADQRVVTTEWTLIVKNEAAHAVIADVTPTYTPPTP